MKVKLNILFPNKAVLAFESQIISADILLPQVAAHILSVMFPNINGVNHLIKNIFYLDQNCQKSVAETEKIDQHENYFMELDQAEYEKMLVGQHTLQKNKIQVAKESAEQMENKEEKLLQVKEETKNGEKKQQPAKKQNFAIPNKDPNISLQQTRNQQPINHNSNLQNIPTQYNPNQNNPHLQKQSFQQQPQQEHHQPQQQKHHQPQQQQQQQSQQQNTKNPRPLPIQTTTNNPPKAEDSTCCQLI